MSNLLPSKELFNVPNIALVGFAAVMTVMLIHFGSIWLEGKNS